MNINEHYYNILKIISSNKRFENIKAGDNVKYSVVRHIEGNKFLINIMGKKIAAEIKGENVKESSFANVVSVFDDKENKKLILRALNSEYTLDKYKSLNEENKTLDKLKDTNKVFSNMLNEKGIKADNKNVEYIKTVLKYMPNLAENEKLLVFSFVSKGIYFNVFELTNIFEGKVFEYFKNNQKKNNINLSFAEKLKEAVYKLFKVSNFSEMKDFIDSNGYFNLLFMIFDSIHNSDNGIKNNKELKEFINLFLRLLSNNRKSGILKENAYFFVMPFVFEGEIKELNIFINEEKEIRDLSILFKDMSGKKSAFEIKIIKHIKNKNLYKIEIHFFDDELYKKFDKIKESALYEAQSILLKQNIYAQTEIFCSKLNT